MTDAPKIRAWQTVLIWSNDHINIGGTLAVSSEIATAQAVYFAMTEAPPPPGATLKTVMAVEVSPDWLRGAVRALDTGGEPAQILSLVQPDLQPVVFKGAPPMTLQPHQDTVESYLSGLMQYNPPGDPPAS
jgi:hypothetical protein